MSAKFKRCLSKIKVPCIRVLHSMKGRINDTVIWKVLLWEKLEEFGIFQLVVLVFLLLFWRHNAMVTTVIDETQRHATSAFSYSPTSLVNLLEYKWGVHVSMNGCPSLCVISFLFGVYPTSRPLTAAGSPFRHPELKRQKKMNKWLDGWRFLRFLFHVFSHYVVLFSLAF